MTSAAIRKLGARQGLGYALLGITLTLFVVTGTLHVTNGEQRSLLSAMVRTSSWTVYQAQLELVKSMAALDLAVAAPNSDNLDNLDLRLEILASRLPILYQSEEAWLVHGVEEFAPALAGFRSRLVAMLDVSSELAVHSETTVLQLRQWRRELQPLAPILQKLLEASVVFNKEVYERERELSRFPAVIPLVLTFVSGSLLLVVQYLGARKDRQRLADLVAAQNAEAALAGNLHEVVKAMPAIMVIFEPDSRAIRFVSPGAAGFLPAAASDPAWRRLVDAALSGCDSDRRGWGLVTLTFPLEGGQVRSLRGSLCEVLWEGRRQLLLALADITLMRGWDLHLMQTAKLATLGEMASAIAHELNQPLAVINMAAANARRLLATDADSGTVGGKLDRIIAQVDRAKRITDQVRRYGRAPSELMEPFSVRQGIGLAISFVAEQYRVAGLRLAIDLDLRGDPMVRGEQIMFEQVIVNLLLNSRDAFQAAAPDLRGPYVHVLARREGDQVVIEVRDEAGGIREDMLGRLFEPFSTSKPAEKGTGLGLAMSRTTVRGMKGTITAENVEGGARFTITLPVETAETRMVAA